MKRGLKNDFFPNIFEHPERMISDHSEFMQKLLCGPAVVIGEVLF